MKKRRKKERKESLRDFFMSTGKENIWGEGSP